MIQQYYIPPPFVNPIPLNSKKLMFSPELIQNNLQVKVVPYEQQTSDIANRQSVFLFNSIHNHHQDFQKYQVLIHTVLQKYNGLEEQLDFLKELLIRLIQNKVLKQTQIKLLYNPNQLHVEKLALKLKLLCSKGRKFYYNSLQVHSQIENTIERCQKFQENYTKSQEGKCLNTISKQRLRNFKYNNLLQFKKRFDIINIRSVHYTTTHTFQEELPERTVFAVPFYNENLLIRPNKELVKFPNYLLFCPVVFDEDDQKPDYKIAPEYLAELEQYQKDWKQKVLMIEIILNEQTQCHSYIQLRYKKIQSTADSLGFLREKVYQFMIWQFLKTVFQTTRSDLYLPGSIPQLKIKFSIQYLPNPNNQIRSVYCSQFTTVLLALLKSPKLKQITSKSLIIKLKTMFQEIYISKTLSHANTYIVSETRSEFSRYFKKTGLGASITPEQILKQLADQNKNK